MKKKEQANQIEQLFRTIKANFKNSGVDVMTKKIDDILSSEQMALKTAETNSWFTNYQSDLSARILNDGNLKNDYLVGVFDSEARKIQQVSVVGERSQIPNPQSLRHQNHQNSAQITPPTHVENVQGHLLQPTKVVSFHEDRASYQLGAQ